MLEYIICIVKYPFQEEKMKIQLEKKGVTLLIWKEEYKENKQIDQRMKEIPSEKGRENILFITDSSYVCKELARKELPVIAFYHEGNRGEVFSWKKIENEVSTSVSESEINGLQYGIEEMEEVPYEYYEQVFRRFKGMPWIVGQTKRCIIREMTVDDAGWIAELYQMEEATRYMTPFHKDDVDDETYVKDYCKNMYEFYEFGIWIVEDKKSGRIIGRAGFEIEGMENQPHLGYIIHPAYQKQGYGFEICQEIIKIGKENYEFEKIFVKIEEANIASINLCKKLGFIYIYEELENGKKYKIFKKL